MRVSVIIPVLNEAASIGACLAQFDTADDIELVVVDGGSTDGTQEIVAQFERVRWCVSPHRGRAAQMNVGARTCPGDVLLFLHADTRLPDDGLALIRASLADDRTVGGRFRLRLSERSFSFRLIGFLSTLRSKHLGVTYGDQGIYVRRSAFENVGGYPLLTLFEDSEFCKALAKQGRFVLLKASVRTSTRRWREWGIWRTVFWMWALRALFDFGVKDTTLSRWYRAVR